MAPNFSSLRAPERTPQPFHFTRALSNLAPDFPCFSISSRRARPRQLCRSSASALPSPPPRLQTDPPGPSPHLRGRGGRETRAGHPAPEPTATRAATPRTGPGRRTPARPTAARRAGSPTAVPAQPTREGRRGAHGRRGMRAARGARGKLRAGETGRAAPKPALDGRGARAASRRGLAPFRVEGADGLTPHPERGASSQPRLDCTIGRCRRDCSPPPLPSGPPPPGSAVGWPRPGAETQKELGAILGGTKQRRNTLPGDGILRTLVYPVPLIL